MPIRFIIITLFALLLLIVLPSFAEIYTEWLWFGETGYQDIFLKSLTTKGLVGIVGFLFALFVLFVNFRLAIRELKGPYTVFPGGGDLQPLVLERKHFSWLAKKLNKM